MEKTHRSVETFGRLQRYILELIVDDRCDRAGIEGGACKICECAGKAVDDREHVRRRRIERYKVAKYRQQCTCHRRKRLRVAIVISNREGSQVKPSHCTDPGYERRRQKGK